MKFYSADVVFPISSQPVFNGIIAVDQHQTIAGVFDNMDAVKNTFKSESNINPVKLQGAIIPGFINCHCHLELSHLRGAIPKHQGLSGFISDIIRLRKLSSHQEIVASMQKAEQAMIHEGIVAVGDISNTDISFDLKNHSDLFFHTFIEVFDLNQAQSVAALNSGLKLLNQLKQNKKGYSGSISPHAPYTVTPALLKLIGALSNNQPVTIHNQESASENELFRLNSGKLKSFFSSLGNALDYIPHHPLSSLHGYIQYFNPDAEVIFVHNTFTQPDDMILAQKTIKKTWWCLCPNANLYIENTLPAINQIASVTDNIVIGTDSLASNDSLSILSELFTIHKNFPEIKVEQLLKWATLNGAKALKADNLLGSIEMGKKPGLVLIKDFDTNNLTLTSNSRVERIL
jgi:cytosine/adenosine deaminase-related metal-dependent hydrolase